MKRLVVAMCGAAALGVASLATQASAAPLSPMNPLTGTQVSTEAQEVAWRRVCRPVQRGPVIVNRCQTVWVGPPRGGRGWYGHGPRPGPRYGYNGPPRGYWGGPRYY